MTKLFAELLLLISVAINAALLIFLAGVLRKVMNDMDDAAFTHFVKSLVLHSKWSPFMETTLNIPAVGALPYSLALKIDGSPRALLSGLPRALSRK